MRQGIAAGTQVFGYGLDTACDVQATHRSYSTEGISFDLNSPWGSQRLSAPLLGRFNVENLLANLTTLLALQPEAWPRLASITAGLQPVTGRMRTWSAALKAAPKKWWWITPTHPMPWVKLWPRCVCTRRARCGWYLAVGAIAIGQAGADGPGR